MVELLYKGEASEVTITRDQNTVRVSQTLADGQTLDVGKPVTLKSALKTEDHVRDLCRSMEFVGFRASL